MASLIEFSEQVANLVEKVGPSVVRVDGGRHQSTSGVVYAPGIIVCSNHGLAHKEGNTVDLGDGIDRPAKALGHDMSVDLAVLKVDGDVGTPAVWGDGAGLKVGHLTLKLGRPGKTVRATLGVVTALGREPWRARGGTQIERYLESDASHQPGFSGGPLVSAAGEVLGVTTTALLRRTSLTIPTATVKKVVDQIIATGRVRRSFLGLTTQPVQLPRDVAQKLGEEIGLLVSGVAADGPAFKAGLLLGDTVLKLGGDEVKSLEDLQVFLSEDHVGEAVPVKVLRGGLVVDVTLTVGERP